MDEHGGSGGHERRGHWGGRPQWEDGPWTSGTNAWVDLVSYGYHPSGERNVPGLSQPTGNGWTNTYTWDAAHRLASVVSPAGTHTYVYPNQGPGVGRISLPGGYYLTNQFDALGRTADTQLRTSGHSILNRLGYEYNAASQRTRISRTNSSHTAWNGYTTNSYDLAGQLRTVHAFNGSGTSVPADNFFYGYDPGWNLLKRTNNVTVTTYTPNVLNQAAGSYDLNGNRTSGAVSYGYDEENQLVLMESASQWKLELSYDGLSRLRVVKD
ncbi:MAG: hypothetical protein KF791_17115 [Verrucomicrobiae bacterium]|nr:hypothetical protein [Verrucomicrobiae bacterium]